MNFLLEQWKKLEPSWFLKAQVRLGFTSPSKELATAGEPFYCACQIVSPRAQPRRLALALCCQRGEMSSTVLTRWLFVPPATFAAALIPSSPGQSPAFTPQGSSCQQLCQMAPLKVMGRPDRLAPPSAAAFGKERLPFLAPPLVCTRDFLPEGWSDPSILTAKPGVVGPFEANAWVPRAHLWAQRHNRLKRSKWCRASNTDTVHHRNPAPEKSRESMPPLSHLQPRFRRLGNWSPQSQSH